MTKGRLIAVSAAAAMAAFVLTLIITIDIRGRSARRQPQTTPAAAQTAASATPGRKIKARLYYVSMDGTKLTGVDREVAYADGPAAQAQEIVNAQLSAAAAPLVSAIPPGTTLRALYLSDRGEAYVDLS